MTPDNKLLMSFDEMMEDLRITFPSIYFFMDLYKNLHIEHLKYEGYNRECGLCLE